MARANKKQQDRRQTLITSGIIILMAAGLAGGLVVAVKQVWRRVTNRQEFRMRAVDFAMADSAMRTEAFRRDLVKRDVPGGALDAYISIYTPDLTQGVAASLSRSPWVKKVNSVSRVFPNSLKIDMELRRPYALLKYGENYYCVDDEGMVLDPAIYIMNADTIAAIGPATVLPAGAGSPHAGKTWNDGSVTEAISMVRLCRERLAKNVQVAQIELESEKDASGPAAMATLVLSSGPRVRWGRTPAGAQSPAEVSTLRKAESLLAITAREGEGISKRHAIDVRWAKPICE